MPLNSNGPAKLELRHDGTILGDGRPVGTFQPTIAPPWLIEGAWENHTQAEARLSEAKAESDDRADRAEEAEDHAAELEETCEDLRAALGKAHVLLRRIYTDPATPAQIRAIITATVNSPPHTQGESAIVMGDPA